MKNQNYKVFIDILLFLFLFLGIINFVLAQGTSESITDRLLNVGESAEYLTPSADDETALPLYIGQVISYILSMLGVIFLVLLVYGGFLWMTARGDSEVVNKAKDIMINAIIGLIIVLMSYAVTHYVVGKIAATTMSDSGFTS